MRLVEYLDAGGRSPFGRWFWKLDATSAAKVTVALLRMENGNLSNAKGVGGGLMEFRIDWGPGYRIYYGHDGTDLVILLCGGTKHRQADDIRKARERFADYRERKEGRAWR